MKTTAEITSIGELASHKGGKNLTPIFKGNVYPLFVHVTQGEFEKVRGNKELMKELAIEKINKEEFQTYSQWISG